MPGDVAAADDGGAPANASRGERQRDERDERDGGRRERDELDNGRNDCRRERDYYFGEWKFIFRGGSLCYRLRNV